MNITTRKLLRVFIDIFPNVFEQWDALNNQKISRGS
jgi:hypothetical protein